MIKKAKIRIFAGPNGSGKSTVIKEVSGRFRMYSYLNADDLLAAAVTEEGYKIPENVIIDIKKLNDFYRQSSWKGKFDFNKSYIVIKDQCLFLETAHSENTYYAALLTDYIRTYCLENRISFSFETVLSHPSKIDFLKQAKIKGYKIYVYFVSTESYEINIGRVKARFAKGGHDVPNDKIKERYKKSLDNLFELAMVADNFYIFDNSKDEYQLVLQREQNEPMEVVCEEAAIPRWVQHYFMKKIKG